VALLVVETLKKHSRKGVLPDDSIVDLFEGGYLDSFGLWESIADLEKATGVQVPDGEATPKNFSNVIQFVNRFSEGV
jgi:acyl carrier protein